MTASKSSRSRLGFVVAGLLLGILMSSMDNTIVARAMRTIVAELGRLDKFVWVTSAYMMAVMASMPIFGKLSDMYGRPESRKRMPRLLACLRIKKNSGSSESNRSRQRSAVSRYYG